MPTLLDMLAVFKDSEIILNIELKGPISISHKGLYNYKLAAETVYKIIIDLGI